MGAGAYAALQTILLHMERFNKTESPIFVLVCSLFLKIFIIQSVGKNIHYSDKIDAQKYLALSILKTTTELFIDQNRVLPDL